MAMIGNKPERQGHEVFLYPRGQSKIVLPLLPTIEWVNYEEEIYELVHT